MSQRDLYQVLGVPRTASVADIRHAYARLAKLHHPDLARGHALPARLDDLQQAYHCLSDAGCRAAHDRALDEGERAHFARQRRVQRELRRYDHRHPHAPPRLGPARWRRWLWIAALGAGVAAGAFALVG